MTDHMELTSLTSVYLAAYLILIQMTKNHLSTSIKTMRQSIIFGG